MTEENSGEARLREKVRKIEALFVGVPNIQKRYSAMSLSPLTQVNRGIPEHSRLSRTAQFQCDGFDDTRYGGS
jgi:hypothetical protein